MDITTAREVCTTPPAGQDAKARLDEIAARLNHDPYLACATDLARALDGLESHLTAAERTRYLILACLFTMEEGAITQHDLGHRVHASASPVSEALGSLVSDGFASDLGEGAPRARTYWSLTDEGTRAARREMARLAKACPDRSPARSLEPEQVALAIVALSGVPHSIQVRTLVELASRSTAGASVSWLARRVDCTKGAITRTLARLGTWGYARLYPHSRLRAVTAQGSLEAYLAAQAMHDAMVTAELAFEVPGRARPREELIG